MAGPATTHHLEPREYTIRPRGEYLWRVVRVNTSTYSHDGTDGWALRFGLYDDYLQKNYCFDLPGPNTALFDTPEAALAFWQEYQAMKAAE